LTRSVSDTVCFELIPLFSGARAEGCRLLQLKMPIIFSCSAGWRLLVNWYRPYFVVKMLNNKKVTSLQPSVRATDKVIAINQQKSN